MDDVNGKFIPEPERNGPIIDKRAAIKAMIATSTKLAQGLAKDLETCTVCVVQCQELSADDCCFFDDAQTKLGAVSFLIWNIEELDDLPHDAPVRRIGGRWIPIDEDEA